MKTLLVLVAIAVGGKFAYDRFAAQRTERDLARVVTTLNERLPQTNGFLRVEKVV